MFIRFKNILSIILISYAICSKGQTKKDPVIDSLLKIISTTGSNQLRTDALCELASQYTNLDSKKATEYATKAITLSKEINYKHGEIEAINMLAILERDQGNYSEALTKLKNALLLAEQNTDSSAIAKSYLSIGDIYSALKSNNKAIANYNEAFTLYYKNKIYDKSITCLNRIANRNMDIGNAVSDTSYFFRAIKIYSKAFEIANRIKDNNKIINAYVNLADAYNILGRATKNKNYFFHSLDNSLHGLKLSRENKNTGLEAINNLNIGDTYDKLGQPFKAIHFYETALHLYELTGDKTWLQNTYTFLGNSYIALKNYDLAISNIDKSIELAKEQKLKSYLRDNYNLLSEIYSYKNDFQKALEYHKKYVDYKDSILNENSALAVERLQTELESDRKDKEIELLNKNKEIQDQKIYSQNTFRNFLVIAVVFLFLLLLLVYNRYRVKQKAELEILKAKETAELAKEVQEQFLANTSHEIRTPMNGIIGMTSQLLDSPLSEDQLEYVTAIKESSANLLVIINDLLDISKIKAGKMVFEEKPFKLSDLFKNLIFTLQYRSTEKNIHLISSIDEKIPETLTGDYVRLNQVLLNLAGNAIKFTEKGEVKIIATLLKTDGKKIRILFSVTDTGIGIPNDKLDQIFESFTQVNATTTRKYGGTGLGLTIAKQIIEQQGGTISVSSKVNEGSSFSFTLEFKKTKETAKETNEQIYSDTIKRNSNFSDITILVVDDNRVNQRVAALTLQKWKANVSIADDAKTALEMLMQKTYHIILMDIAMPEMDGIEATQYIRKKMPVPISLTPIIAMTASALIGEREKCLKAGMNDYISKPFNPNDLYEKIVKLIPEKLIKETGQLTDLSLLNKRAEGDTEYLKEIFESYATEMPIYTAEMKHFLSDKNWNGISRQAHKMKSPVALVGAYTLKKQLEIIELEAINPTNEEELIASIEKANAMCLKTIEEIEDELILLKKNNS